MNPFRRPRTAAAAGDPIPFEHDGDVHLFYLSSPSGTLDYPERVRTTWQHAVTNDLRDWQQLPPAVEPGPEGSYDGGGIWTGSVVEKNGTFYLFYTGHHVGAENPQTICLATSTDLVTFEKHGANPLVAPATLCEPVDWRDPYVFFHEEEQRWWMLIAARLVDGPYWQRGCIMLATSDDLVSWTVEDEPFYVPGNTYCPECPELWQGADGRWHLVYSRFSEDVGTVTRVADSARGPFREPERPELGGRRWYAAKSAVLPSGFTAGSASAERVFFGWVHDAVTDEDRGHRWLWGGDFALPRVVSIASSGSLEVSPVIPVWDVTVAEVSGEAEAPGTIARIPLAESLPEKAVVSATFASVGSLLPARVGLNLVSNERGGGWQVDVSPRHGEVRLTPVPAPLDDFWADLTGREAEYREVDGAWQGRSRLTGGLADVRVVLVREGDLLEVYVDDQVALTHRFDDGGRYAVELRVEDGTARYSASVSGA